jgi:hypothetical protein
MMFDNHAVKKRIKEIIEADADLYDSAGVPGKIAQVYIGYPKNKNIHAISPTPYCVITNHVDLLKVQPYAQQVNNQWTSKQNFVKYMIIVADRQESGELVEKSLDEILYKIINTLDKNIALRKPDGTDPLAKKSLVAGGSALQAGQYQGQATDGFELDFEVLVLS